jgi:hypothetical protein
MMRDRQTMMAINFDIDGYLLNGGRILDLIMDPPTAAERAQLEADAMSGKMTDEVRDRIRRIGRYLERLGQFRKPEEVVEEELTEKQLRDIWRATERADQ